MIIDSVMRYSNNAYVFVVLVNTYYFIFLYHKINYISNFYGTIL